jgi:hypothetical protein
MNNCSLLLIPFAFFLLEHLLFFYFLWLIAFRFFQMLMAIKMVIRIFCAFMYNINKTCVHPNN